MSRSTGSATDLHLRFNLKNARHQEANDFINTVKSKQKTALITACTEAYRQLHPHGIDYKELEAIQKESWSGFLPKVSILENLQKTPAPAAPKAEPQTEPMEVNRVSSAVDKALDQANDFYDLNSDDDE